VHTSTWPFWLPKKTLACIRFRNDPCVHMFSESPLLSFLAHYVTFQFFSNFLSITCGVNLSTSGRLSVFCFTIPGMERTAERLASNVFGWCDRNIVHFEDSTLTCPRTWCRSKRQYFRRTSSC